MKIKQKGHERSFLFVSLLLAAGLPFCSEPLRTVQFYATALKQNYCKELGKAEREKKRGRRGGQRAPAPSGESRGSCGREELGKGEENRKRRMWVKANRCAGRHAAGRRSTAQQTQQTTSGSRVEANFKCKMNHSCAFCTVAVLGIKFTGRSLTDNNQSRKCMMCF